MSTQQLNHAFEASIMSNSQYRRFSNLPVCSALTNDETQQLFACMEATTVAAGTVIYEAKSPSNQTICLITEGIASVSRPGNNLYSQLQAGDHFGLFSFLDEDRKHAATVKAVTDLELLTISRAYFDLITLEDPQCGNRVLRFMFHLLSERALEVGHEYALIHKIVTGSRY